MKTICPPSYYHNGIVATHALGGTCGIVYIYIYILHTHIYVIMQTVCPHVITTMALWQIIHLGT